MSAVFTRREFKLNLEPFLQSNQQHSILNTLKHRLCDSTLAPFTMISVTELGKFALYSDGD